MATIYGTVEDDENLSGSSGNDVLYGGPAGSNQNAENGNDSLFGEGGNDVLRSGGGHDSLHGGSGNDILIAGAGNDVLEDEQPFGFGVWGNDRLIGGAGADILVSYGGVDTLDGGAGFDRAVIDRSHATAALTLDMAATPGTTILVGDGTTIASFEAIEITGGQGNDRFVAGAGDDILSGGRGSDILRGGAGDDVLYDDLSYGFGGSDGDSLSGGAGNDRLISYAGADTIDGGTGHDTAVIDRTSATAALTLNGTSATGTTTLFGDGSKLTNVETLEITGGSGNDRFVSGAGDDTLAGNGGSDVLNGGAGSNFLFDDGRFRYSSGNSDDDRLLGAAGDDTLVSSGGADTLDGGMGVDTVDIDRSSASNALSFVMTSSTGPTTLVGDGTTVANVENIRLDGGSGNDRFVTGAGADHLDGGSGNDTLNAGSGDDVLISEAGLDTLDGGAGLDTAYLDRSSATAALSFTMASATSPTVLVGDGTTLVNIENIKIYGGGRNDRFTTGAGDDLLFGGGGANILPGGAGNDGLYDGYAVSSPSGTRPANGNDVLNGGDGDDRLTSSDGIDTLDGGDGDDTAYLSRSSATTALSFTMTDPATRTTLVGDGTSVVDAENIHLLGGDHDDRFVTGAGTDVLDGGAGNDALSGGAGDDILAGNLGNDVLNGGAGSDRIDYRINFSLTGWTINLATGRATDGSERDVLISIENVVTGFSDDVLIGNAAANVLDGGAGSDVLDGGEGSDTASYWSTYFGALTVDLAAGTAIAVGSDQRSLDIDRLVSIENVIGSKDDDVLRGNAAANVLDGGYGNDVLDGRGGSDTVSFALDELGGVTIDLAVGRAVTAGITNGDIDEGSTFTDTLIGIENAIGSRSGDTLTGNVGANALDGRDGDDILDGGLARDMLTGGFGSDTFAFSTAFGTTNVDRIADFSHAEDTIRLSKSVFAALTAGELEASAFKDIAVGRIDADDRILYNSKTGVLLYDADGSGSDAAAVAIANLLNKPTELDHTDFLVV